MTLLVGCDPEVFYIRDGAMVSAVEKIPGTKYEPYEVEKGFFTLADNVAAEFNCPPAPDKEVFRTNVIKGLQFLGDYAKINGIAVSKKASASFPPSELLTPESQEFGCEPDFNAWTLEQNPSPSAKDITLRSCGGHIHIGTDTDDPANIVRAMDIFLGIPSLLLDNDSDRRLLYGRAGSFRYKSYGAEYRTLSNFWIFDLDLIDWVWSATEAAVEFATNYKVEAKAYGWVRTMIDTGKYVTQWGYSPEDKTAQVKELVNTILPAKHKLA